MRHSVVYYQVLKMQIKIRSWDVRYKKFTLSEELFFSLAILKRLTYSYNLIKELIKKVQNPFLKK